MIKDFIKLSGILCAITLIASLLLAGVNYITKTKIAEAEERATVEAMQKILPDAENFEEVEKNVFEGRKGDTVIGYCSKVKTIGYGGAIEMIVAFDLNGTVCGIEILSHSETAGLGAKATDDSFKGQFKGKNSQLTVVKGETFDPSQVSAITGATITSRAVAEDGIKSAYESVAGLLERASEKNGEALVLSLLPGAEKIEKVHEYAFEGIDKDGNKTGLCLDFTLVGNEIRFRTLVIVDDQDKITDVRVLEHTYGIETYEELSDAAKEAVFKNAEMILDEITEQGGAE